MTGAGQRGTGFGADLHGLCLAGRYDLPSVAAAYAQANSGVAGTGDMRVEYQGSDLEQAGEALCQAAATYAATDHEAAVEMDRLNRQLPTDVPWAPSVRYPAGCVASEAG